MEENTFKSFQGCKRTNWNKPWQDQVCRKLDRDPDKVKEYLCGN